jgi:hypothetical protein
MLNGYSAQLARRKAPPAAEKTEASNGGLIPRAPVIAIANSRSKPPLKRAVVRVCHPSRSKIPRTVSAQVEIMARVGAAGLGKNQLTIPVYVTNLANVPHATCGSPKAPHNPNRSATADRKETASATRRKTELKAASIVEPSFLSFSRKCCMGAFVRSCASADRQGEAFDRVIAATSPALRSE